VSARTAGRAIDRLKQVNSMRLEGKIAIVTGGSRGIGRACVARLAAEGAAVAFVYNSAKEAADVLVAELCSQGFQVQALQADVRDARRAQEIVDSLTSGDKRIDILVNSAGITKDGLTGSMTDDQWRDVIDTNLAGTFNYCRAVSQPMMM